MNAEEVHAVFVARMLIHYKWYMEEMRMEHHPIEKHLEASEMLARIAFRLDQRWFDAMMREIHP